MYMFTLLLFSLISLLFTHNILTIQVMLLSFLILYLWLDDVVVQFQNDLAENMRLESENAYVSCCSKWYKYLSTSIQRDDTNGLKVVEALLKI